MLPDNFPNDKDIVAPVYYQNCVYCGDVLMELWDVQCCKTCLREVVKREEADGWISSRFFDYQMYRPGDLLRLWWRGDVNTMFLRAVLRVGATNMSPWLIVIDPQTGNVWSWNVSAIQAELIPLLRGRQLGVQKISQECF